MARELQGELRVMECALLPQLYSLSSSRLLNRVYRCSHNMHWGKYCLWMPVCMHV
jgi:hypothetical protein